mmetsp:Transcript_42099/g.68596  ORF Transcript_42099/g.68596 Transcript_42099/m.68596 type:complete len:232 (-) Transcript_42099:160-855(-)
MDKLQRGRLRNRHHPQLQSLPALRVRHILKGRRRLIVRHRHHLQHHRPREVLSSIQLQLALTLSVQTGTCRHSEHTPVHALTSQPHSPLLQSHTSILHTLQARRAAVDLQHQRLTGIHQRQLRHQQRATLLLQDHRVNQRGLQHGSIADASHRQADQHLTGRLRPTILLRCSGHHPQHSHPSKVRSRVHTQRAVQPLHTTAQQVPAVFLRLQLHAVEGHRRQPSRTRIQPH